MRWPNIGGVERTNSAERYQEIRPLERKTSKLIVTMINLDECSSDSTCEQCCETEFVSTVCVYNSDGIIEIYHDLAHESTHDTVSCRESKHSKNDLSSELDGESVYSNIVTNR